jgi:lipid-binding SYLF domain-containing protein
MGESSQAILHLRLQAICTLAHSIGLAYALVWLCAHHDGLDRANRRPIFNRSKTMIQRTTQDTAQSATHISASASHAMLAMPLMRRRLHKLMLVTAASLALAGVSNLASAATAEDLNHDAAQALETLYKSNPTALTISKNAKAILVFPKIIKAGLVFGGSYGEGVLNKGGVNAGYYNSVTASWGWQAGAESYGYVVFLMSDKAVKYLDESKGWEVGIGPNVVVVNEGVAKNLSSSTLKDDAYAFIFDQQGLMASLSIEGTKISRIKR